MLSDEWKWTTFQDSRCHCGSNCNLEKILWLKNTESRQTQQKNTCWQLSTCIHVWKLTLLFDLYEEITKHLVVMSVTHLAVSPSSAYSEDHGSFSDFCSLAVSTRTFVLRANADGKCAYLQLWCAISRVTLPDTLNPQGFNPPPTSLLQLRGRKRSIL